MFHRNIIVRLGMLTSLCACTGCSSCITVVPPKISITGEKTAIERQIVGEYRELEKDAWVVSSVRTPVYGIRAGAAGATGDTELLTALRVREFHDETIRSFKNQGALGENSEGYLSLQPGAPGDPDGKRKLLAVIEEENRARRTIFMRSVAPRGQDASEGEIARVGREFAREQARAALRGDWIQGGNGVWSRKK